MATRDERTLLDRLTKRPISHSTSAEKGEPISLAWEELRISLEGAEPQVRRRAAAHAAKLWRSLPEDLALKNVRLLSGVWRYHSSLNDHPRLAQTARRLVSLGLMRGQQQLHAEGLLATGVLLLAQGRVSDAIQSLELSRAFFGTSRVNWHDYIRSSILLADAYSILGDRTSAFAILSRARIQCLETEDVVLLSAVSLTLGIVQFETGDLRAAQSSFNFAIESSKVLKSERRALRATLGLALVHIRSGRIDEAEELATHVLQAEARIVSPREAILAHEILGDVALCRHEWTSAHTQYASSLRQSRKAETSAELRSELHRKLAEFWILYGTPQKASLHIRTVLSKSSERTTREDYLAMSRLDAMRLAGNSSVPTTIQALSTHAEEVARLGFGYEHLLTAWSIVSIADEAKIRNTAEEWWARVVYLAKSCGAEPLLERWRQIREEKGYLRPAPMASEDGLEGEPGPHARLIGALPAVDLAAHHIITRSRRLHEHAASIAQIAPTVVPVLLRGESGTGKELFARLVHDLSPRRNAPFLAINCGAIPTEILESELFGHRRGSFTGAIADRVGLFRAADQGTLFLDEIGEMAAAAQTKLLRVLETGELRRIGDTSIEHVNVRIVSATNVELERQVESGAFRKDLYYRLRGLDLELPPLRDRRGDIPLLAAHFLELATSSQPKQLTLPFETQGWLMSLPWPGNVRELRLAVERAVAMAADGEALQSAHFMEGDAPIVHASLPEELEAIERVRVLHALDAADWNKASAARLLGMSRTTLNGRIKKLGIEDREHP